MKTTTRKPYASSRPLAAALSTSKEARLARVRKAFSALGLDSSDVFFIHKDAKPSGDAVRLPNGVEVLVSYKTVVAYRLLGSGTAYCETLGTHSRTTDKAIRGFSARAPIELVPAYFAESVADACTY